MTNLENTVTWEMATKVLRDKLHQPSQRDYDEAVDAKLLTREITTGHYWHTKPGFMLGLKNLKKLAEQQK